jgi:xanthine dehydrogenase accessory factor
MIAISAARGMAGYVSNGCVDADLELQGRQAIETGEARTVRYGVGSPFVDVRLPCGGAVDVLIVPDPAAEVVEDALAALRRREPIAMQVSVEGGLERAAGDAELPGWDGETFEFTCHPKIRLRIAGRGAELVTLARLALAAGMDVLVQSPDEGSRLDSERLGAEVQALSVPSDPPPHRDDPWTAFVLLFHEHEWEGALLKSTLEGPAYYVGALGSRRTHAARCESLRAAGVPHRDIDRVRGPIGLVPALRDASHLAISILAEIVAAHSDGRRP